MADSKLASLLMGTQEPTKFQRKAALRANDIASRMAIPTNSRYKQQMMEIPGESGVTGQYATPGRLPGMERLINALQLAESTMQRNRGERERPNGLTALYGMVRK